MNLRDLDSLSMRSEIAGDFELHIISKHSCSLFDHFVPVSKVPMYVTSIFRYDIFI